MFEIVLKYREHGHLKIRERGAREELEGKNWC